MRARVFTMGVVFNKIKLHVMICIVFIMCTHCSHSTDVDTVEHCKTWFPHSYHCSFLPEDIPDDITEVVVKKDHGLGKTDAFRRGQNWDNVTKLTIFNTELPHFLNELRNLEELHVHDDFIRYDIKDVVNLSQLKVLDFNACRRLRISQVFDVLNATGRFPQLHTLLLSEVGTFVNEFIEINGSISSLLHGINTLNLSYIRIADFDISGFFGNMNICDSLTHLDLSFTSIQRIIWPKVFTGVCKSLKVLEISHSKLPFSLTKYANTVGELNKNRDVVFICMRSQFHDRFYVPRTSYVILIDGKEFSVVQHLDITGIFDKSFPVTFRNVTFRFEHECAWNLVHLVAKDNNLHYIDARIQCENSTLETLDMSENVIVFLNPGFISCFKSLTEINVSFNRLNVMLTENETLFSEMFANLTNLKAIHLAWNELTFIPKNMFSGNPHLTEISLSNNALTHISFDMQHLHNLTNIDLSNNRINVIELSNDVLNLFQFHLLRASYSTGNDETIISLQIDLTGNEMVCSSCYEYESLKFIQQYSTFFNLDETCQSDYGPIVYDNDTFVQEMQTKCDPVQWNDVILTALTAITIYVCLTIFAQHEQEKRLNRIRHEEEMELQRVKHEEEMERNRIRLEKEMELNRIRHEQEIELERIRMETEIQLNLIQHGNGKYELLVFLSFACDDGDFVKSCVIEDLQHCLCDLTHCNRYLICIGDKHFLPGQSIKSQIDHFLPKCSCLIFVLSQYSCVSEYCLYELRQAKTMGMPILLMPIEEVDRNNMCPLLQELFDNNVRILWEKEGDTYILKTTWPNIAKSIFDLL